MLYSMSPRVGIKAKCKHMSTEELARHLINISNGVSRALSKMKMIGI